MTQNKLESAIDSYQKALSLYESKDNAQGQAAVYSRLAIVHVLRAAGNVNNPLPSDPPIIIPLTPPTFKAVASDPPLPFPQPLPSPPSIPGERQSTIDDLVIAAYLAAAEACSADGDCLSEAFARLKVGDYQLSQAIAASEPSD